MLFKVLAGIAGVSGLILIHFAVCRSRTIAACRSELKATSALLKDASSKLPRAERELAHQNAEFLLTEAESWFPRKIHFVRRKDPKFSPSRW